MKSKFKAQYSEEEWNRLTKNAEFNKAFEGGDLDKAGILADNIIYHGGAKSLSEARRIRKNVDALKDFGK